jgi:ribosomal protein L7/L12/DNA-binding beta-propeller fold protein YncE
VIQSSQVFGGVGYIDFGDLSALTGKALKIGEIQRLIQSGQKIYAIKLFRETFGVGLKEAKDAVDAMEEGKSIDLSGMLVKTSATGLQSNAQSLAEIQGLLRSGQKIEAIKRFREMTGVGLKEAKDAVEAIERGENLDISRMQLSSANAQMSYQSSAQNLAAAKKIGYTASGSILGTVIVTLVLIVAAILGVFYLVSRSVNKALDKSVTTAPTAATPQPLKSAAQEKTSIAQEILKFGGEGTGAGKFQDNRTIAVDPDGKIYSADFSGGRVQVFDAQGNFQMQIMADTGKTVDALAVDRKGNLFVLQGYDINRLNKETGESLGKYRVDYASDLAIGLDGKIYVPGRRGGITVLSAEGAKLKTIEISKDLNLDYVQQLAVDGTGNLFVLDGRNLAVFKLSPDGKLLTRFGGRGTGPSDKMPKAMFAGSVAGLAIDSQGRIYVSQVSRISVFDPNGNFLNEFKATQAFGMTFNDRDELYVAARPFVVKYKVSL